MTLSEQAAFIFLIDHRNSTTHSTTAGIGGDTTLILCDVMVIPLRSTAMARFRGYRSADRASLGRA
jgi:hypothetical protein